MICDFNRIWCSFPHLGYLSESIFKCCCLGGVLHLHSCGLGSLPGGSIAGIIVHSCDSNSRNDIFTEVFIFNDVFCSKSIVLFNELWVLNIITNLAAMPVSEGKDGWFGLSEQVHSCNNRRWHWKYHPLVPNNRMASIQCKEYLAA